MGFLFPAFLLGALAIAVPIVLHLFRRDVAPEVPFSAVRLLQRSPVTRTRRRSLRDLILLAARVAALALLAFAFARPYLRAGELTRLHIVAVDRSYSMGGPGRFARALELARDAVGEIGINDRVAVIAFDDRADVIAPPGPAADARMALTGLRTGFRATRYAPAIERALELSAGAPARLIVISDLQRTGWDGEQRVRLPGNLTVETRDAGSVAGNAAVTAVRVEADRVVATVANRSAAPLTTTVRLSADGDVVASVPVRVTPNGSADAIVRYRAADLASLAVSVEDPTGFPADDVRYAVAGAAEGVRVAILTAGGSAQSGLYLTRALQAAGERFVVDSAPARGVLQAGAADAPRALVVLSTRGFDSGMREDLASYVRGGGGAVFASGPDMETSVIASTFGWPEPRIVSHAASVTLAASDVRHPIFRPFGAFAANLGQVRFSRTWKVDEGGWEIPARFADGSPALLERAEGKGRVLLFASDLDRRWNEFPLHAGYVPFVAEAVLYAADAAESGREYVVADAPTGAKPEPGIYTVSGRRVAVNVDTRESAAQTISSSAFDAMLERSGGDSAEGQAPAVRRAQVLEAERGLWQYGLVLMLGALLVESVVGRK